MASTNKTPQLGLNQWEPGDSVLREDFNGDNAKLEAAVGPMLGNPKVGKYKGDGIDKRQIECGFRPSCVLMSFQSLNSSDEMYFLFDDGYHRLGSGSLYYTTGPGITFTATGFEVIHTNAVNKLNCTYRYVAFR